MSAEVKSLMENKPVHWTQQGLCRGDERFTGRFEDLTLVDLSELGETCFRCPVLDECRAWAADLDVTDVFAAGYWRWPVDD